MPKKKKLETPTNKQNLVKFNYVAIMNENPKSSEFDPNHLTVEELKKVIAAHGESHKGFTHKCQYINLVLQLQGKETTVTEESDGEYEEYEEYVEESGQVPQENIQRQPVTESCGSRFFWE